MPKRCALAGPRVVENLAMLLQIPRHRIKVVSVQGIKRPTTGRRLQAAATGVVVQIVEDVDESQQLSQVGGPPRFLPINFRSEGG